MSKSSEETSLLKEWLAGGLANAVTSGILNPMDVAKTRLQIQQKTSNVKIGLAHTIRVMYQEEGVIGLWRPGLAASMIREMVNSGARAGFYTSIRDPIYKILDTEDLNANNSLFPKIVAAMMTGTIGSVLSNPIDLIKIRLMNNPQMYPSITMAFKNIVETEGFMGLYKGVIPSTLRGAFIAAGELASYDHSKTVLKSYFGIKEGTVLHVSASLITGVIATTVAAPFDMLKTRAMNNSGVNMSLTRLLVTSIHQEGFSVLFRGWIPSYLRLGPHALLCFPIFEQIRSMMGLKYL